MKNLTKIIFVVLAAAVVVSTVAILTPRAVRAAVAMLIQDVDSPPRNPWSASCTIPTSSSDFAGCVIPSKSGQEITIQTLTFQGFTSTKNTHLVIDLSANIAGNLIYWYRQIDQVMLQSDPAHSNPYAYSTPLTFYADPSGGIIVSIRTNSDNPEGTGMGGVVSLVGYTVNLGASN
jgi:hypothetical protein